MTDKLWILNDEGRVFTLDLRSRQLEEHKTRSKDIYEFKRLCAVPGCVFGMGSDHMIYVYVPPSDIPIRVQECTYENERWQPNGKWAGSYLFMTDRQEWSDIDGNGFQPRESFHLPSYHWEWEENWYVDENLRGEVTDRGGWQYAVNFPATFTAQKTWKSCVRKRRWVRFRRYISNDRWAKLEGLDSHGTELFIDISVGGFQIPSIRETRYCVWTVTVSGKVYVREGVTEDCPEGISWTHIPTSDVVGIISMSCGPRGMAWAVTWDGQALIRIGVNRDSIYGTAWLKLLSPDIEHPLQQVCVGTDAIWALTRDGKVWFRKGVNSLSATHDCRGLLGELWVEMVGEYNLLVIGQADQVLALSYGDGLLSYRTSVTPGQLTGMRWQSLNIGSQSRFNPLRSSLARSSSESSILSLQQMGSALGQKDHPSLSSPFSVAESTDNDEVADVSDNSISWIPWTELVPATEIISRDSAYFGETEDTELEANRVKDNCLQGHSCDMKNTLDDVFVGSSVQTNKNEIDPPHQESELIHSMINRSADILSEKSSRNHKLGQVTEHSRKDLVKHDSEDSNYDDDVIINFATDLMDDEDDDKSIQSAPVYNSARDSDQCAIEETDYVPETLLCDFSNKTSLSTLTVSVFSIDSSNILSSNSSLISASESGNVSEELVSNRVENKSTVPSPYLRYIPGSVKVQDSERVVDYIEKDWRITPSSDQGGSGVQCWIWVSAMACSLDDIILKPWIPRDKDVFLEYNEESFSLSPHVRDVIYRSLQYRNKQQRDRFSHIEEAIEKTFWVKKAQLKFRTDSRQDRWLQCSVELEQGLNNRASADSMMFIHITHHKKVTHIQLNLAEIMCVARTSDPSHEPVFGIFTAERLEARKSPLFLMAGSESEAEEWICAITLACSDLREGQCSVRPSSIWSTTILGDVFVHEPDVHITNLCSMYWRQVGGHMAIVETGYDGLAWAIGYDNTAWVYNGGYGGGIFRGVGSANYNTHQQTDVRQTYIYENQRWHLLLGYSYRSLLSDKYTWTDKTGKIAMSKTSVKLPSTNWNWDADWSVDYSTPGGVDKDGWQYGADFGRLDFHSKSVWGDSVRRRRWVRHCKLTTSGPWVMGGTIPIVDVSIQLDAPINTDSIAVWAIAANGDILCRMGVTKQLPQGQSWQHVIADQPFRAVSVGGQYRVWAVAHDGSVWFRNGVSPETPTGKCWFHVVPPPPQASLLRVVSAGKSQVWAVDTKGTLYFRKDITPIFPEGTEWVPICKNICNVSVGPENQVWAVATYVSGNSGPLSGVVCRRVGISDKYPTGTGWASGIGGGLQAISLRGLSKF